MTMTEQSFGVLVALGMTVLWLLGAWRVARKKDGGVLGWKVSVGVFAVLGFQWMYFALYLSQHPNEQTLLGSLAVPLLLVVPALVAIGAWVIWVALGRSTR